MRLLFASIHSYLDPSGGAALSTRELLELLAAHGADCRALTAGVLDYERETTLDEVLAGLDLPSQRFRADLRSPGGSVEVIDLTVNGVRVTLMPTASSRAERSPDMRESACFLEPGRPGSGAVSAPCAADLRRSSRLPGADAAGSDDAGSRSYFTCTTSVTTIAGPLPMLRPSSSPRNTLGATARTLGIDGPVIPDPIPLDRVVAENPEPKYVTFINPQPAKGLTVFARIAELTSAGRRFPSWWSKAAARRRHWRSFRSIFRA